MDISKLRKQVSNLNKERAKLLNKLLRPKKMIRGSIYEAGRKCGNPNCKCAKGEKHISYYLSTRRDGRTKLIYVRNTDKDYVIGEALNYRAYQKSMSKLRKLNNNIFEILKELRDLNTKDYK